MAECWSGDCHRQSQRWKLLPMGSLPRRDMECSHRERTSSPWCWLADSPQRKSSRASRVPAQYSLEGSLCTSPTDRVKQDINPTWDGLQRNPSLLGGGIRSLSPVRIFLDQSLRLAGLGGGAGNMLHPL